MRQTSHGHALFSLLGLQCGVHCLTVTTPSSCTIAVASLLLALLVCEWHFLQPAPQGVNASYIACSQKLIVVLTVDSGNAVATQDLSFQLSCVGR